MKIKQLINRLQEIKDKDRDVSVVLGNEDTNLLTFDYFEIHNEDNDTSLEIFCFEE